MRLDVLKNTIEKEKKILEELNFLLEQRKKVDEKERMFFDKSLFSLIHQFSILNDSIPELIDRKESKELVVPKFSRVMTREGKFYVPKFERERFLEDLEIEKSLIGKIKKKARAQEKEKEKDKEKEIEGQGFKKFQRTSGILAIANSLFSSLAFELSKSKTFEGLKYSLRKANMPFLLSAYLSLMFFFTFLSFFLGLFGAFFISISSHATILIFIRNIALSFLIPMIVFISFYYYPNSKISGTKQDIENELPFAIVHMSAVSSSGVSPDKIFHILALSEEYRHIAKEARKIVNQINIYGYDLTTALRNVASITSNKKFAELLNGISATITGGGNLSNYLDEKAKDTLLDYKLSREKYANTIAMFADIYTALLIAAPLMFMLILVIISSLGTGLIGLDPSSLSTIGIIIIVILNVVFLIFLELTQPKT